jgi:hypothetical protein
MLQEEKYKLKTDTEYHVIGGLRLLVQKWLSEGMKEGLKGVRQNHNIYRDKKLIVSQIGLAVVSQRVRRESATDYPSAAKKHWTP